ncbi:MAG: lipid-A-disaccharide synthase [Candidatus Aminicenantes bacterium]|nr:lipid-A-disaccharide synthase [Candidatus Aminicenantes bacterium]
MPNVLVIAAENSAENYGAQVIDEFKKHNSGINFFGVGGDKFVERGVDVLVHNRELAVIGIIEVISSLLKLKRIMKLLLRAAVEREAAAVLLIDYPDFNLRIAKKFKKLGIPVYYYISPTVWAWRYSRVKLIKKYVDHIFIIFPFEVEIFEKEKIPFTYTGHPLVPMIKVDEERGAFREKLGLEESEILLTLLPGSRGTEVVFLLAEMLKAVELLAREFKIKVFLLLADNIERELVTGILEGSSQQVVIIEQRQGHNLINASDVVVTTCGTSNLEIAVIGTPFVAVYRLSKLSYFLGKRFVKIDRYSIVNILAQKEVIAELIQEDYSAGNIVKEVRRILQDGDFRREMLVEFDRIREKVTRGQDPPRIIFDKISQDLKILPNQKF